MMIGKIILLISFTMLSCKSVLHVQGYNPNINEMISEHEAELLNSLLENTRGTFDFHGKKIVFITGSSGSRILSKTEYFSYIKPWIDAGETPQIYMVELTKEEKNKSGGYDAFVLSWVKVLTDKRKKKVIEKLAKK